MKAAHAAAIARLHDYVAREIPLTAAMQLSIRRWDGRELVVEAPLAPNRNHKATAFGGSLYSLAVVACWGLFVLRLWDEGFDCEIVIQQAQATYLLPVNSRMVAKCDFADEKAWHSLVAQLRRRRRGRIALAAEIVAGKDVAFRLEGRFVAHIRD